MAEKKKTTKKKAAPKKTAAKKTTAASTTKGDTSLGMKFGDYAIVKKRSGRYEVRTSAGKQVNGPDKAKVLVEAKLVKTGLSKKAAPEEAAPSA